MGFLPNKGAFRKTAMVRNGRVNIGATVRVVDGRQFTVEAVWQEFDRRTGSVTFVCGPSGTIPVPALHCEVVN